MMSNGPAPKRTRFAEDSQTSVDGSLAEPSTNRVYIKKIEMKRFRSFADTTIEFHPGINLLVGQNGSGKSSIIKAVELCLAAIQTSYKKSALSNARTTFLSPIVTSGKQQQPTVLKIVLGDVNTQQSPGSAELGEHHIRVEAHFNRDSTQLQILYNIDGQNVTFAQLHERLRSIGVTTKSVQFIRQNQPFSSDEFESGTLMKQLSNLVDAAVWKHWQKWAEHIRESGAEAVTKAAQDIDRAEAILKQLKDASTLQAKYLALKKQKRKLELQLNGDELRALKSQIVKLELDLSQVSKSYWPIATSLEEILSTRKALQSQLSSARLYGAEGAFIRKQLVILQNQLNTLNNDLNSKQTYVKKLRVDVFKCQSTESKIRSLETQISESADSLQQMASRIKDLEDEIGTKAARKDALIRVLTARTHGEQGVLDSMEDARITRETQTLKMMIPKYKSKMNMLKASKHDKERTIKELGEKLKTVQDQLRAHSSAEDDLQDRRNLLLNENQLIISEIIKISNNSSSFELESAREQLAAAMGPLANVYFRIPDIYERLRHYKDFDGFCGCILDLIHVDEAYRVAVRAAEEFLYSFVVPNLEIADLFAKVLVELQLNDESIRVIVLDNYNYKRAEESTAGPPGATPLEDYVALDDRDEFRKSPKLRSQIFQIIAAELRNFWLLGSETYELENIEDTLQLFDDRRFSKLTFVSPTGDIITRHGVTARTCSPYHDIISIYEKFKRLSRTEHAPNQRIAIYKKNERKICEKLANNQSALATERGVIAELSYEHVNVLHRKVMLEKMLIIDEHIMKIYGDRYERAEKELQMRNYYVNEVSRLAKEDEQYSEDELRTELKDIAEELHQLNAELTSFMEQHGNTQVEHAALQSERIGLQEQLLRQYDDWAIYQDSLIGEAASRITCIKRHIAETNRRLAGYETRLADLSSRIPDTIDAENKLTQAIETGDIHTSSVGMIEDQMTAMRARLTNLRGRYNYLGGNPDDTASDDVSKENDEEVVATEEEMRTQLKDLCEQLLEFPAESFLLDETMADKLADQLEKYRNFYDALRYVVETGLDMVETNFIQLRRAVERSALSDIGEQMQKVFSSIVPQGQVTWIPVYSSQGEGDQSENESDLVSLEVKARFGPTEPLRGIDMFSGGQRAIMSLVLATAGSCICQQQILLLDEVDASLDELHCTRLAELLKDISTRTQVVLISHRFDSDKASFVDQVHKVVRYDGTTFVEPVISV
ncbi:uncharacterized protein LOC111243752 [Varroa destructor]|uniref:Structural maintenance of chromosomes protein n=1 Tax=Varroa destructor TaxID=109461 RepID=A0A7M7J7H4_VARDE|nr:uncharacterized protein LOC111243752 [Varroa destructor]XP_022645518.1 uncharacterized protein LOC111243752 [Varroa destructor]XP_022645519.1 uncharacterized protein LOC111243752 [Varroa destructor]